MEKEADDQVLRVEVEENIKITLIDPSPKHQHESLRDLTALTSFCPKEERLNVKYSPLLRRSHAKALSMGDSTDNEESRKSFTQNRQLWQQRASSHTSIANLGLAKELRDFRPKHTPDLVMDLPIPEGVKSPEENAELTATATSNEPESPDMALAAERFAKQNQCTLKKNTRDLRHRKEKTEKNGTAGAGGAVCSGSDDESAQMISSPAIKPQIKAKPQILRKPIMTSSPTVPPLQIIHQESMEQQ